MYYIVIAALIAVDQVIKKAVTGSFGVHESISLTGDFFNITYIKNSGVAFSMFEGAGTILAMIPLAASLAAIVFIIRRNGKTSKVLMWGLSLIAGGGIGNIIDRIAYGYVIDYVSIGKFAVFNFADVCVCIGCALLASYVLFVYERVGSIKSVKKRKRK